MVDELLAAQSIIVSYQTVCQLALKFGWCLQSHIASTKG